MPFARASELDRLLACPGSIVLPRMDNRSERAKEAADFGTMVHRWKETGNVPAGRPGLTLKKKIKESGVDRNALWAEGLHEVPVALNVVTGEPRALVVPVSTEKKDAWKAAHGPEWVTGTADYVGMLLDLPWVDDLKTGRKVDYIDYRYQQGFYSLVWTLFQMKELAPCRSTITHWPKYPIPDPPTRFGTVLEPDFFADFQHKLRTLYNDSLRLRKLQEDGMDVVSRLTDGAQCIYCPSKLSCTKGQKYE